MAFCHQQGLSYFQVFENDRVCNKHFKSGKPAKDWEKHNEDWVPTQYLGHSKQQVKNPEAATQRANRTAERHKRIQESAQQEREKKLAKLNEPGETVEHIFTGTNLDSSVETQETENCSQSSVNDSETQSSNLSASLFFFQLDGG